MQKPFSLPRSAGYPRQAGFDMSCKQIDYQETAMQFLFGSDLFPDQRLYSITQTGTTEESPGSIG